MITKVEAIAIASSVIVLCAALCPIDLAAAETERFEGYTGCYNEASGPSDTFNNLLGAVQRPLTAKTVIRPDIHANGDGTYTSVGPAPLRLAVVTDGQWAGKQEKLTRWIKEAEAIFTNSGVSVAFEVACASADFRMPEFVKLGFDYLKTQATDIARRNRADLVVGLTSRIYGDSYCGVATLGSSQYRIRSSMTSCSPVTLAHEIAHNLGVHHAHQTGYEGRKGYCRAPYASARACTDGTVMSYAGSGRVPLFAHRDAEYLGGLLGTEEFSAVQWLNTHIAGHALAWEFTYDHTWSQRATAAARGIEQTIID